MFYYYYTKYLIIKVVRNVEAYSHKINCSDSLPFAVSIKAY